MKKILVSLATTLALVGFTNLGHAANLYWSGDGTTAGGAGTWNTTTSNFRWGTAAAGPFGRAWTNASVDTAIFSTGGTSTNTVTLNSAVTANKLIFPTNGYIIAGNTLTFSGTDAGVETQTSGGATTLSANYTGTSLTKTGPGRLDLNNTSYSIQKYVLKGGAVSMQAANRLGTAPGSLKSDWFDFDGGGFAHVTPTGMDLGPNRGITIRAGNAYFSANTVSHQTIIGAPIVGTAGGALIVTNGAPFVSPYAVGCNLILSNVNNSYNGPTRLAAGTLTLALSGVIPDTSDLHIHSGTLAMNSQTETVDTVTLYSGAISGGGTLTANSFDLRAGTATTTLAGASATATKSTTGSVTLSSANTFGGGLTLSAGTIILGNNASAGTGTLALNGGVYAGSAARNVANAVTWGGNIILSNSFALTFSGTNNVTGTRVITNDNTVTISGSIGGTGGFIKRGTGNLTLTGAANSYSGTTTISNGIVQVNGTSRLGNEAGTLVLAGGTLQSSATRTASTAPIGNPVSLTDDSTITTTSSAATVDMNFTNNSVVGTAGILTFAAAPTGTGTFKPRLTGGGFNFTRPVVLTNGPTSFVELGLWNAATSGDQTISGEISGNGSLFRSVTSGTAGNTILTASNSFTGNIQLNSGGIGIGHDNALSTGAVTVNGGGLFAHGASRTVTKDLNVTAGFVIGGAQDIDFAGTLTLGAANRTFTVTNSAATTISGVIASTATIGVTAWTKAGSSTLLIPVANDYAGNTAVTAGRLKVTNPTGSATGSGSVNVTSTGILSGNGSVTAASASGGGTIAPGASVGILTITDATFGTAGVYQMEMADADTNQTPGVAGWDFIDIQGTLNITATAGFPFVINLDSMGDTAANFDNTETYDWIIATAAGGIIGFAPDKFTVSTNNFLNDSSAGGFGVTVEDGTNLVLHFAIPPSISVQPVGSTNAIGASVSMSVTASGTAPLGYQWKKNGSDIGSATDSSYAIGSVASADAGSYTVLVHNIAGTKLSDIAIVGILPQINTNPLNSTNNPGDNVAFTVAADGQAPLTYQWKKNGVNISGANATSYNIASVAGLDAAGYSVAVTNAVGDVVSATANLYVSPDILDQPDNISTNSGTGTLTVVVSGSPVFDFQWTREGTNLVDVVGKLEGAVTNGVSVSNSVSLVISNLTPADAGDYAVIISNSFGVVTSAVAVVSVQDPVITTEPTNLTVNAGETAVFSAVALASGSPVYQWYQGVTPVANDVRISGADTASLTITLAQQSDAGPYSLVVTNLSGSVTSAPAILTVIDPPVVTVQPDDVHVGVGSNAVFTISHTGTSPGLQWKKGVTTLVDGGSISGATTGSLTITGVSVGDAGNDYHVVLTNAAGSTESSNAALVVYITPEVTVDPVSRTRAIGTNVIFSVTATGTSPQYQWKKATLVDTNDLVNGGDVSGATSASLTLANLTAADDADYFVVVTNVAGSDESAKATLTVIAGVEITVQPQSQTVTNGDDVEFTVTATGDGTLFYQWKKNGGNIDNETTTALNLTSVTLADAANYTVNVSNAANSVTSDIAALTVNQAPSISVQPVNQSVGRTSNATFTVTAIGNPLNYQWRKDGDNIGGATTSSLNVTSVDSTDIGYYSVVITNNQGSVTSSSALLAITNSYLFTENFDVNHSSLWKVNSSHQTNNNTTNSAELFFDYSTVGVPPAPNSGGTTRGLRMRANMVGAVQSGLSVSPIGQSFPGDFILRCDMWLNFNGPLDVGGTGSTQITGAGIGTAGTAPQYGNAAPDSIFFCMTGDGQTVNDYRAYSSVSGAGLGYLTNSGVYAAGSGFGSNADTNAYYAGLGGKTAPAAQLALFPVQTSPTATGAAGFAWRNVVITKTNGITKFTLDNKLIATITNSTVTLGGNNILFNHFDINATIASPANQATNLLFGLVDNVRVEAVAVGAPLVTLHPSNLTTNAGTTAVLSVAATSSTTIRYQWRFNGANIAGATNATLSISNVVAANAGTYQVLVLNDSSAVESDSATLTVIDPAINSQPQSITTNTLQSVTFTVGAAGTGTLQYQWYKDDDDIDGEVGSSYNIPETATTDSGDYHVIVTGDLGSITSSIATLTVNLSTQSITFANPGGKTYGDPSFTVSATASSSLPVTFTSLTPGVVSISDNTNVTILAAGSATIRASAAGDANYSAAVDVDRTFDVDPAPLTVTADDKARSQGQTNPVFTGTILGVQYGDNITATYDAPGTDENSPSGDYPIIPSLVDPDTKLGNYSLTTNHGTLTVFGVPVITVQPDNVTTNIGGTALFSVTATGSGTLSYQWLLDDTNVLTDEGIVTGSTSATLTLTGVALTNSGNYSVVVSNEAGGVLSSNASLTVTKISQTIDFGELDDKTYGDVPFNVSATASSSLPVSFSIVSGPATILVDQITITGAGDVTVRASQAGDDDYDAAPDVDQLFTVAPALLSVTADDKERGFGQAEPEFTGSIVGIQYGDDITATYATTADNLSPAGEYPIIPTLVDPDTKLGNYSVITNHGTLTVIDLPIITSQPVDVATNLGATATFAVTATGEGTLTYQWRFNDTNDLVEAGVVSGVTSATLTLTGVSITNVGNYSVVVSNESGGVISSNAALTLPDPPQITQQPSNIGGTTLQGASVNFSVVATNGPLSYQWKTNGTAVGGATGSSFTWLNTQVADTNILFSVEVSNPIGTTNSANVSIALVQGDANKPTVGVTTPKVGGGVGTSAVTLTGSVKDLSNGGLAANSGIITSVKYRYNPGNVLLAESETNTAALTDLTKGKWSFTSAPNQLSLLPGTNIVHVWAQDLAGNVSDNLSPFFVFYDVTNNLVLKINGTGTGTGVKVNGVIYNGPSTNVIVGKFKVGRLYTAETFVLAGNNSVFTNWTASPTNIGHSTNTWVQKSKLPFVMQPAMTLTAQFNADPYPAVLGKYYGLFYESGGVTHETAGHIYVTVKKKAGYSGTMLFDGNKVKFSGKFNADGTVNTQVVRSSFNNKLPVQLAMGINFDSESIGGTVSNETWVSDLYANKQVFFKNLGPFDTTNAGSYTFQLPSDLIDEPNGPKGVSFAWLTNSPEGIMKYGGQMADGSKFTGKMNISREGALPFYVPLYKNVTPGPALNEYKGSVLGWLNFDDADFDGVNTLSWIKKDGSEYQAIYGAGFTNNVALVGSPYVPPLPLNLPITVNPLDRIIVTDGNLLQPVTNLVTVSALGKVKLAPLNTALFLNKAAISFKAKDGTFAGAFLDGLNKRITKGVVLQNTGAAAGHFVGTSESGTVILAPAE